MTGGTEEADIDSQLEVLVNAALRLTLTRIHGVSSVSSFFVKSLLSDSANAFLTMRTGIDQDESFLDAAVPQTFIHLRSNFDKCSSGREIKP